MASVIVSESIWYDWSLIAPLHFIWLMKLFIHTFTEWSYLHYDIIYPKLSSRSDYSLYKIIYSMKSFATQTVSMLIAKYLEQKHLDQNIISNVIISSLKLRIVCRCNLARSYIK